MFTVTVFILHLVHLPVRQRRASARSTGTPTWYHVPTYVIPHILPLSARILFVPTFLLSLRQVLYLEPNNTIAMIYFHNKLLTRKGGYPGSWHCSGVDNRDEIGPGRTILD